MTRFIPNPAFSAEFRLWIGRNMHHICKQALPYIRRLIPQDTGELRRSIDVIRRGKEAGFKMPYYGWYLERGTGIYGPFKQPIYPRSARYLVWRARRKDVIAGRAQKVGQLIFAKSVRGIKPYRFIYRGLQDFLRFGRFRL